MKVALITITEGTNYGNRLQNYAVQKSLQKLGITAETLKNKSGSETKNITLKLKIKKIISRMKHKLINLKNKKIIECRKKIFNQFNEKYITFSNITINNDYKDEKINDLYDYFICGSDQIWNPEFKENAQANFLQFASQEKRIAFCPSFGVSTVPSERKEEYSNYLKGIPKLSVREEDGAKIIKELINKEAKVLVDPTLLLSETEWKEIMQVPLNIPKKKYILTYFLGNISTERKSKIEKMAEKYNLDVINLGKIDYKEYYTIGPSEFLWYVNNAEVVFTDSFHACVFSIIFDKTFYIFEREDKIKPMNSRIDTLLTKFSLQEQKFSKWDKITLHHEYSNVEKVLRDENEKSLKFLKEVLKIEE